MTDQTEPRRSRRTTVIIVAVLALVILAVVGIGLISSGSATPATTTAPPSALASSPVVATSSPSSSATPTRVPTTSSSSTPAITASTPQPTKTATISSSAPIVKSLTAAVTKMEAVQGTASGPGEIAGPSVRFTITITNTTGKAFSLSNTVVNAYAGASAAPALPLQGPGGKPFPSSVANGATATGVFVFNIPTADRGKVEVTVDTSVNNPVVAFKGAAPR